MAGRRDDARAADSMPLTASYMATVVKAYVRAAPGVLVWIAGLPERTASSARSTHRVATLAVLAEATGGRTHRPR